MNHRCITSKVLGKSVFSCRLSTIEKSSVIRYDFVPDVLTRSSVDEWVKTVDGESFVAARQLMQSEGLLVGGSSGAALAGALKWLKSDEGFKKVGGVEGKNAVVLFADGYAAFFRQATMILIISLGYATISRSHGSLTLSRAMGHRLLLHKLQISLAPRLDQSILPLSLLQMVLPAASPMLSTVSPMVSTALLSTAMLTDSHSSALYLHLCLYYDLFLF